MTGPRGVPGASGSFIVAVSVAGAAAAVAAMLVRPPALDAHALLFVGLAVAAGWVRVPLPVGGSLSPAFAFVSATLMTFGLGASAAASVLSAVATSLLPGRSQQRPPAHRIAFNAGVVGISSTVSGVIYLALGGPVGAVDPLRDIVPILASSAAFSSLNLGLISLAIHLSGEEHAGSSLRANYIWSVPSFLAGSSLAVLLTLFIQRGHFGSFLLATPFVYLMHLAYRARSRQAEEEKRHSQQSAEHYRAVTEALALAIEAKDENTEDHLRRVQHFSLGIGRAIGLSGPQMEALKAASLLHDVGKIAVPEYILTKPGRLTPEEFEKMKIHPRVGADILSVVPFPYPLAPIVRHHHERWDGTGYPDGLAGEDIPVGARVLSVADCYDALTSDRPYRKALPASEAIAFLERERGKMFDPSVVEAFLPALPSLEAASRAVTAASAAPPGPGSRADGVLAERHASPIAAASSRSRIYDEITSSQREQRALYDIARTVGHHLGLDESLTLLSAKIAHLVPYRALVVYLYNDDRRRLVAQFATGQAAARLKEVEIPVGERLSGWAALHRRAYIGRSHDRPLERDGSRSDLEDLSFDPEVSELRSSLVAPLATGFEDVGVLALYHGASFAYGPDHLRLLQAVGGYVAQAIENARRLSETRPESLTDPLTGIPNSRFFYIEAGCRIDRAAEVGSGLGIVAFRVTALEEVQRTLGPTAAARILGQAARRLAALTRVGETLVRFGGDLFLVLTHEHQPRQLAERAQEMLEQVQADPIDARFGIAQAVHLLATHASFPTDGATTEQILDAIESRLQADGLSVGGSHPIPGVENPLATSKRNFA
ncbi:MAG: HD domain-containing protein [Acidobacteriia bacterium]|nr:HD domain-containing protein [Terriglobia bacterium]